MVQRIIAKRFGEEVIEYLNLKGKATRVVYSSAFGHFLNFYGNKYGEGKGFSHFLDRIFAELQKPRREQKRVAETELLDFINYLKELVKSNNTVRLYFAAEERQDFVSLDGKDYEVADLMARFDCGHNKALDIRSWLLKHYPLEPGKSP